MYTVYITLMHFSFLPRQADTRISTEFGTTNNSTDAEPDNEDELDELLDNNSSTVPVQNKPFPSTAEYRQLSLEKRAKLLPPPSDDRMEELKIGRKKASRVRVEFYPEVPEMSKRVEKSKQDKSRVLPRGA